MGEYGLVANAPTAGKVWRSGAKLWIVDGHSGDGWERRICYGLSKYGGRRIRKWTSLRILRNFRAAWIPPNIESEIRGSKEDMESIARQLNAHLKQDG